MRKTEKDLDYNAMRALITYDPFTGIFRRKDGSVFGYGHGHRYLRGCILGVPVLQHRLAFFYMTGKWPPRTVDHKPDTCKSNNRWDNLQLATYGEQNAGKPKAGAGADYTGWPCVRVVWRKDGTVRFMSTKRNGGSAGTFDTAVEGFHAYRLGGGKKWPKSLMKRLEYLEFLGKLNDNDQREGGSGQRERRGSASYYFGA